MFILMSNGCIPLNYLKTVLRLQFETDNKIFSSDYMYIHMHKSEKPIGKIKYNTETFRYSLNFNYNNIIIEAEKLTDNDLLQYINFLFERFIS